MALASQCSTYASDFGNRLIILKPASQTLFERFNILMGRVEPKVRHQH